MPRGGAGRRAPSQQRSLRRVEAILAAARQILQDDSATDISVRAVAEVAGTSPASVYRYFDDIDQLLDAVVAEHALVSGAVVSAALASSRHRTVAGVFELVARTMLDFYDRRPELAVAWRSPALAERQRILDQETDAGLARAVGVHLHELGAMGAVTPAVEARLVADWVTVGALMGHALRADPAHRSDREADLIDLVRWLASRY